VDLIGVHPKSVGERSQNNRLMRCIPTIYVERRVVKNSVQPKQQKATSAAKRRSPRAISIIRFLVRSDGNNFRQSNGISSADSASALSRSYGVGESFSCSDAVDKSQMENFSFVVMVCLLFEGVWLL